MPWNPPFDPYGELADEAVHQDAVASRVRARELLDRASELATWVGSLRDLAERGTTVVVRTGEGTTHRGVLVAVGIDHLAMRLPSGTLVLVADDAVASVRPEPTTPAPAARGDRARSQDRTLVEVLERIVDEHRSVVIGLRGIGDPVRGVVIGLGVDVLTLRLDGAGHGTAYVPLRALREVVVEA